MARILKEVSKVSFIFAEILTALGCFALCCWSSWRGNKIAIWILETSCKNFLWYHYSMIKLEHDKTSLKIRTKMRYRFINIWDLFINIIRHVFNVLKHLINQKSFSEWQRALRIGTLASKPDNWKVFSD